MLDLVTTIYNGLEITRINAGDKTSQGNGAPIPTSVNVVNAGSSCSPSESHPCCWRGATSGSNCNDDNSIYSGCNRTVCDWWASDKICSSLGDGWRLPTSDEVLSWKQDSNSALITTLTGIGDYSLQLCDASSGYSAPWCQYASRCPGSANGYCNPCYVWSGSVASASNSGHYYLGQGAFRGPYSDAKSYAFSVRCVSGN